MENIEQEFNLEDTKEIIQKLEATERYCEAISGLVDGFKAMCADIEDKKEQTLVFSVQMLEILGELDVRQNAMEAGAEPKHYLYAAAANAIMDFTWFFDEIYDDEAYADTAIRVRGIEKLVEARVKWLKESGYPEALALWREMVQDFLAEEGDHE